MVVKYGKGGNWKSIKKRYNQEKPKDTKAKKEDIDQLLKGKNPILKQIIKNFLENFKTSIGYIFENENTDLIKNIMPIYITTSYDPMDLEIRLNKFLNAAIKLKKVGEN